MECGVLNTEKCRTDKSETIRNLIVWENRKRMRKRAPEIAKRDTKLQKLLKEEKALRTERRKVGNSLEDVGVKISKRLHELKITGRERAVYDNNRFKGYRTTFTEDEDICYISKKDTTLLQKASNLFALGRKKEAKEIWSALVEKHGLDDPIE